MLRRGDHRRSPSACDPVRGRLHAVCAVDRLRRRVERRRAAKSGPWARRFGATPATRWISPAPPPTRPTLVKSATVKRVRKDAPFNPVATRLSRVYELCRTRQRAFARAGPVRQTRGAHGYAWTRGRTGFTIPCL